MKRQKARAAPLNSERLPGVTKGEPQPAHVLYCPGLLQVMDALPFYAMLVDASHTILVANSAVREHLGVSPQEIVGRYCPKAIHGLDGPFPGCPLEAAAEKGQPVEYELLDKGTGRWLRSAVYPTKGKTADGKQVFFHMVNDITEHKVAQDRLRVSQEQL